MKEYDFASCISLQDICAYFSCPYPCDEKQLKTAYWKMIGQYHPDKVNGMGPEIKKLAEEKTKEINGMYEKYQDAKSDELRQERERQERERQERERQERERQERERQERERQERERLERERLERERLERERLERERQERERQEREKQERERRNQERLERERLEKEKQGQNDCQQESYNNYRIDQEILHESNNHQSKSKSKSKNVFVILLAGIAGFMLFVHIVQGCPAQKEPGRLSLPRAEYVLPKTEGSSITVKSDILTEYFGISHEQRQKTNLFIKDAHEYRYNGNGTWTITKKSAVNSARENYIDTNNKNEVENYLHGLGF